VDEAAARRHEPTVVFVDEHNRLREKRAEIPGPRLPERARNGGPGACGATPGTSPG
jgi:hypothetical protein